MNSNPDSTRYMESPAATPSPAAPTRGACTLGFANRTDAGPYRRHEGPVPGLSFCASTRHGGQLIEVTGLTQASLLNGSCVRK